MMSLPEEFSATHQHTLESGTGEQIECDDIQRPKKLFKARKVKFREMNESPQLPAGSSHPEEDFELWKPFQPIPVINQFIEPNSLLKHVFLQILTRKIKKLGLKIKGNEVDAYKLISLAFQPLI